MFEYTKRQYGVTPEINQVINHYGKRGVITRDNGHYLGVVFDDNPGVVSNVHPTDSVEYTDEKDKPKKGKRSAARYRGWLNYCEYCGEVSFGDYLKHQLYKE